MQNHHLSSPLGNASSKHALRLSAGGDETGSSPPCTLADTKSWEVKMIEYVQGTLGKQVMGWEEVLFKTNAASNDSGVIVDSWARSSWQQAATLDHRTVVRGNARSFSSFFLYFRPEFVLANHRCSLVDHGRVLVLLVTTGQQQRQFVPRYP
eukprot:COSAG06_NODE_8080_length_2279_cov_1.860092_3_plen_152_part_00